MERILLRVIAIFFIASGLWIALFVEDPRKWFTVITHVAIGSVVLKNRIITKQKEKKGVLDVSRLRIFANDPYSAAIFYFIFYYGLMSLLKDFRVITGHGISGYGFNYLTALLMVLLTYLDQNKKSKTSTEKSAE